MPGIQSHPLATSSWSSDCPPPLFPPGLRPELHFYITRDDGSYVPLIPADELPHNVRLCDVSLRLDPSQVKGMRFAGHYPSTGKRFTHGSHFATKSDVHFSLPAPRPLSYNEQPLQRDTVSRIYPPRGSRYLNTHLTQALNDTPVISPEPRPFCPKPLYNVRPLPPSGVEPDPKKKVYCTYWIQHASCNFAQQGCLYKHEMPDLETLKSIGIHKFPPWWVKQQTARKRDTHANARIESSSSEWEEVDRQQTENSNLHNKGNNNNSISVRVPPPSTLAVKRNSITVSKKLPQPTVSTSKRNASTMTTTKTKPINHSPDSPTGGVRLGTPTTTKQLVSTITLKPPQNPCLDSPIEDDLIDFDVLEPSSSDTSTPTQSSYESSPQSISKQNISKHDASSPIKRRVPTKKLASTTTKCRTGKDNPKDQVWQAISKAAEIEKKVGKVSRTAGFDKGSVRGV